MGPSDGASRNFDDDPVTIAVMGPMGSGKSSLIKALTKSPDIVVGNDLGPETSVVAGYPVTIDSINYMLIDTPGFDDTYLSNHEVLERIASWIEKAQPPVRLSGIIYLYRITDEKFHGGSQNSFRIFYRLCGDDYCSSVILATTFWDEVANEKIGTYREDYLKRTEYWAQMIKNGAQVERIRNYNKCNQLLKTIAKTAAKSGPKHSHLQTVLREGNLRSSIVASIADDPELAALNPTGCQSERSPSSSDGQAKLKEARHRERARKEQERRIMEIQKQEKQAKAEIEKKERAARVAEEKQQKLEQDKHARSEALRLNNIQKKNARAQIRAEEQSAEALRQQRDTQIRQQAVQGHSSSDSDEAIICCVSSCCCLIIFAVAIFIILIIVLVCIHVFAGLL